mmetsp:Transcript_1312/g.2806  ORF Transcript_1312/g.2806 Transcript_1312/m.2806 type:complete len:200 (-) Transcript_1312:245-844(-)
MTQRARSARFAFRKRPSLARSALAQLELTAALPAEVGVELAISEAGHGVIGMRPSAGTTSWRVAFVPLSANASHAAELRIPCVRRSKRASSSTRGRVSLTIRSSRRPTVERIPLVVYKGRRIPAILTDSCSCCYTCEMNTRTASTVRPGTPTARIWQATVLGSPRLSTSLTMTRWMTPEREASMTEHHFLSAYSLAWHM